MLAALLLNRSQRGLGALAQGGRIRRKDDYDFLNARDYAAPAAFARDKSRLGQFEHLGPGVPAPKLPKGADLQSSVVQFGRVNEPAEAVVVSAMLLLFLDM